MENYNNQQNNNNSYYNNPQQAPYYNQGYQPYAQPQPYYQPQQPQAPVKKKNRGFGVFAVILCVFVAIGIVANTIILVKNNSSKSDSSSSSSQNENKDFDSLNENALLPGVDSGNNDLVLKIQQSKGKKLTTSEIAGNCKNCVVGITTYSKNGMLHDEASGIVIGTNSKKTKTYILTCAHVVSEESNDENKYVYRIMDSSSAEHTAAVIGYDKSCDIAVLSVEKVGFKSAVFGDSGAVKSGETVIAVGNPGGSQFYGSVTKGIVSATDRMVTTSMSSMACIQHDAAINPGSSGGALLNEYGQIIGINYSKMADSSYEGMSFAVPSATAVKKANQIIKTSLKTSGAKIGIEYYVAASYFDDNYKQLVINTIDKKSDLYGKAKEGDFIIACNGEKIKDKYTIVKKIGELSAGDEIKLTIAHKNLKGEYDTKEVSVKLIEK